MKENPQGYFGPYLDRQETADLIGKYVESHLVFLFQGIPPSYLKHILKHGVLETEPAYADDVKLVFNVWYPSARSTVPTLQRSVDNRVYGYVAFLTTEALRHFDLNMGTELRDGEHWHKRTRTLITLPQRPQPNRVWAWSYRISKPSFAPTRERLVTRPYKQAMADMLNEIGWKHNDSRAVTWKDVEEGRPPIRRNPERLGPGYGWPFFFENPRDTTYTKNSVPAAPESWPSYVQQRLARLEQQVADEGYMLLSINWFTPRPYIDEWNVGSREEGFVYTAQKGLYPEVGQTVFARSGLP